MKPIPGIARVSDNRQRHFGAATRYTFVTIVVEGRPVRLALTESELKRAIERGHDNREDAPPSRASDLPGFVRAWLGDAD